MTEQIVTASSPTGNDDLKQVITRIGTLMRTLRESMRELGLEKVFSRLLLAFLMAKTVYAILRK